jgi:hypothetical protein
MNMRLLLNLLAGVALAALLGAVQFVGSWILFSVGVLKYPTGVHSIFADDTGKWKPKPRVRIVILCTIIVLAVIVLYIWKGVPDLL